MQLYTAANRYRLKLYKFIQPAKGKIIRPVPSTAASSGYQGSVHLQGSFMKGLLNIVILEG